MKRLQFSTLIIAFLCTPLTQGQNPASPPRENLPISADSRLIVELFAQSPDIVQPISMVFDKKGRLLVIESHTHFRPANYQGPTRDRVRIIEDTNGDGKADRFTTFFEGTSFTMDIAVHPDGTVFLATRNEILRLVDADKDGIAESSQRVVFLETKGNYPHNGLSGLTFDFQGNLIFGMGENLGEPYKLIGSDGKTIIGGGEGGNVFLCTAMGKNLRRMATGFWNPFGATRDIFGRLFVVDNDPDASPPCRLVQVVEGADFGFQFRYGRSGRHVFQSWNGELPGTLPYVVGTGESPCEVISYESDGLPDDYLGNLLVPAWADHRVERYLLKPRGAGLIAERKPFIQGGKNFRPSGMVTAPDGSLFVSDWVSQSYELHGQGAIWHIKSRDTLPVPRSNLAGEAVSSLDRPTREAAARQLAREENGRDTLRQLLVSRNNRLRATAIAALADVGDTQTDWFRIAREESETGNRELVVKYLIEQGKNVDSFAKTVEPPALRAIAIAGLKDHLAKTICFDLLGDDDPFLRHAAIHRLAASPKILESIDPLSIQAPKLRVGLLLAWLASESPMKRKIVGTFLKDSDPEIRFLAIKAVSDGAWAEFQPTIADSLKNTTLDHRSLIGLSTTLARINKQPVNEESLTTTFLDRLKNKETPPSMRLMALRGIPSLSGKLTIGQLTGLLKENDPALSIESLRAIKDRGDQTAAPAVREILADPGQPVPVRAQALLTLSALGTEKSTTLLEWAQKGENEIRQEALRGLIKIPLSKAQMETLEKWSASHPEDRDQIYRLLGKPHHQNRPGITALDAWVERFKGTGDMEAGRRIFEHSKLANCAKCHSVDGRGAAVGPDLSLLGKTDRRWILESLTQPGNSVAPHYQSWIIETRDGRLRNGILSGTHLDESVFVDQEGNKFKVQAVEMASMTARKESLMPDGLLEILTDQEVLDLLSFLESKK